jgi:hypothetical protein
VIDAHLFTSRAVAICTTGRVLLCPRVPDRHKDGGGALVSAQLSMDDFVYDNTNANSTSPASPADGGEFNFADFIDLDAIAASAAECKSRVSVATSNIADSEYS